MIDITIFTDPRCGPSRQLKKTLKEEGQDLNIEEVSIHSNPIYINNQQVLGTPITQVHRDGKVIHNILGYYPDVVDRIKGVFSE